MARKDGLLNGHQRLAIVGLKGLTALKIQSYGVTMTPIPLAALFQHQKQFGIGHSVCGAHADTEGIDPGGHI